MAFIEEKWTWSWITVKYSCITFFFSLEILIRVKIRIHNTCIKMNYQICYTYSRKLLYSKLMGAELISLFSHCEMFVSQLHSASKSNLKLRFRLNIFIFRNVSAGTLLRCSLATYYLLNPYGHDQDACQTALSALINCQVAWHALIYQGMFTTSTAERFLHCYWFDVEFCASRPLIYKFMSENH